MAANVGNIGLTTEDLKKVRPDIGVYLIDGQTDFSNQIAMANAQEHRNIAAQLRLEYPEYSETEIIALIDKVKDSDIEQTLYHRRIFMTLMEIFSSNNALEEAEYYRRRVDAIPLRYYIDHDDDDTEDSGESRNLPSERITFGR